MKPSPVSVLMYGRNARLLEALRPVVESRGYAVRVLTQLSELNSIPVNPAPAFFILCHSLSSAERIVASALASARWRAIQSLSLSADTAQSLKGAINPLLRTKGAPATLLSRIGELVSHGGSSPCSHIY